MPFRAGSLASLYATRPRPMEFGNIKYLVAKGIMSEEEANTLLTIQARYLNIAYITQLIETRLLHFKDALFKDIDELKALATANHIDISTPFKIFEIEPEAAAIEHE